MPVSQKKPAKPKPISRAHALELARAAVAVTEFIDFSVYLDKIYESIKSKVSPYSYSHFAEDLGFSKSNVIWLVITKRRSLSTVSCARIVKALALTKLNRRYFEKLVEISNEKDSEKKEVRYQELLKLRMESIEDISKRRILLYFAEWYHPVIRELTQSPEFNPDPQWISSKLFFHVSPKEIKVSLDLLESLNLIKFNKKSKTYEHTGEHVLPSNDIFGFAAIRYQQKMCDMAKESLSSIDPALRDLNALTINTSKEAIPQVKAVLAKTIEKLIKIEENNRGNEVLQLNLQMFPFTKPE